VSAPPRSAAEFDDYLERIARGSKLTGVLGVAGLLLVLGALVISTKRLVDARQELAKGRRDLVEVERQVVAKRDELDRVQRELLTSTDSLARVQAGAAAFKAVVEERSPVVAAAAEVARDSAVAATVVYIQFRGTLPRPLANELRGQLNSGGFNAPDVERIDRDYGNSVRYFHARDSAAAGEVARVTSTFFARRRCPADFPVQAARVRGAPEGQVEVWINVSCRSAAPR
jgi:hypothetical protein